LSVIIAARSGLTPVHRCVASLRAAPLWGSFETIIVNCLGQEAEEALQQSGPGVIVVPADPTWSIARQRATGIQIATGEVVAVLHERYQVRPDWVSVVIRLHARECDVVGGGVAPGTGLSLAAWAMYLTEYSHLCDPVVCEYLSAAGAAMLPGGNVSYKRSVLSLSDMAAALWELDFHAALFAAGARFLRADAMQAVFATPYSWREYIAERYRVSHDLASRRARHLRAIQRYLAAAARVALPALVAGRIAARLLARRGFRTRFLLALPWILFFGGVQAFGEAAGYVADARA
jgi:Glycosyl transferase family 2